MSLSSIPSAEALVPLRDAYLEAQLRGARREAIRLLMEEGLRKGVGVLALQKHVIAAAQREIGRLWQENRISVAQEHQATAISHVALAHLYQQSQPEPANGRRIVVACVPGEQHDFPARLLADALDLCGFEVRYLGADVPQRDLIELVKRERPQLLCLSVTMSFNVPSLKAVVAALREEVPELRLAVGGHACQWEAGLCAGLGAEVTGEDALEVVEKIRGLLGVRGARSAEEVGATVAAEGAPA